MVKTSEHAPGQPGLAPRWATSRKNGVGTARGLASHVWFTTSDGILTEVFYPRIDRAAVRDMGMIVTDGAAFFSEEQTDTVSTVSWLKDGVPGFHISNVCNDGRYAIDKILIADPQRHVVLQQTRFTPRRGPMDDYHLYVLLAPHLGNQGGHNSARVGEFKGVPMLLAECNGSALALACSAPWKRRSAGYVGASDGWQDLHQHRSMAWEFECADEGNVALTGEIDLSGGGAFLLALGFGRNLNEAAHRARASVAGGFDGARERYESEWTTWQRSLRPLASGSKANSAAYRVSTAVLATHESKDFPGGTIASLSFPWGEIHGDQDEGGYHLVWPRDAYETASALLAAGASAEVLRALDFFAVTQEADGHWPQNMWLDGSRFWENIQLDETAAPILLLDLARRHARVGPAELTRLWQMVRAAAGFIVRQGPSTPEDRWEEDAGLTPYSLACMIAALLVAAEMADEHQEMTLGSYLRETADVWNAAIEGWLYVEGTELATRVGVDGYYVRIAPPDRLSGATPLTGESIHILNRADDAVFPVDAIVSTDALALVRFGLRPADDPRVVNTVRVIDAVLRVDTPTGPGWHRYNLDGYGEHTDGSPFDGTGVGRVWPLLAGERAHYELAAGHAAEAHRLLGAMEAQAGNSGLIPEQIWDTAAIPDKDLFPGRPTGSARPLVWAHAEHVKLLRSLA
ncbi:MAG: glycoside hydrolase family 15 protein, partial [Vicinamibacterales bacterium]